MKGTKYKILDKSRELFNEFGFSQVTIRMIAKELNMSSGNLNYHFRKREEILEALYFEMVAVFDERVNTIHDQAISLPFMLSSVQVSMQRMVEYRFFWTDLYHLQKSNEKIKAHFESIKKERIKGYQFLFEYFIKRNILKKPTFSNEYNQLIERMLDYSNTWLYASALYDNNNSTDDIIERSSFHLLSMLYPYLTSQSKGEFRKMQAHFF